MLTRIIAIAVILVSLPGIAQAEAGSFVLGRVEGTEHVHSSFRGDPGAGVTDTDPQFGFVLAELHPELAALRHSLNTV